jgi:hypothetical protein
MRSRIAKIGQCNMKSHIDKVGRCDARGCIDKAGRCDMMVVCDGNEVSMCAVNNAGANDSQGTLAMGNCGFKC